MAKTPLKNQINRFFFRNRDKGIHNLMLYIAIGCVAVYVLHLLNVKDPYITQLLVFDRDSILHGQVWRLFTYPLTFLVGSIPFLGLLGLVFYIWCGQILEQYWGTLKFNLFYLSGILLLDLSGLLLGSEATVDDLNLSLFLAAATVIPEQQIRIWFVLPVKMKWLAWIDLGATLYRLVNGIFTMIYYLTHTGVLYLGWLLVLVPLGNYFLFFGRSFVNVLPDFLRFHPKKRQFKTVIKPNHVRQTGNYRFRCTVCGRTDAEYPNLEFRYCSKCTGYRCYCQDHINNHAHITNIGE